LASAIASYFEKMTFVGNHRKINNQMIGPQNLSGRITDLESEGKNVIAVFIEDKLVGLLAVSDTLRENAKQLIAEIRRNMKKKDIMIMGVDNDRNANTTAKKLGIMMISSQVLPESKALEIRKLQDQGKKVVMVGDGINDAPALTQADIGIAIGTGTDAALSSGHIMRMKSDIRQILYTLGLSQYSLRKVKQNYLCHLFYNNINVCWIISWCYKFSCT